MAVTPARWAAFTILLRVGRESAYAIELLHSGLLDELSAADRNLTNEIVMGVLRWRSLLDSAIAEFINIAFRKLDVEVLTALRIGAYQLAFLTRTPGHAIVNESVELVKQARKRSAATLVNAVMRKLERARHRLKLTGKGPAADYAHPEWLVKRWEAELGQASAEAVCRYDQQVPATAVRLGSPEDEAQLKAEGIQLAPGLLMRNARTVISGDVTQSTLFRSGRIAIQDEGSQLVAALVGQGRRILDCCAAPGSKTGALATALPEAEIFAADVYPHRARLLRQMVPGENVRVITADARQLPFGAEFDRVLADVPCSGTGTLARNPEIKWRLKPEDLQDLQARQIAILTSAMSRVASGGKLIYSTCSLEREENSDVVQQALTRYESFRLLDCREELARLQAEGELVWKDLDSLISGPYLRTIPGIHPCDGFFAAILERKSATD